VGSLGFAFSVLLFLPPSGGCQGQFASGKGERAEAPLLRRM